MMNSAYFLAIRQVCHLTSYLIAYTLQMTQCAECMPIKCEVTGSIQGYFDVSLPIVQLCWMFHDGTEMS